MEPKYELTPRGFFGLYFETATETDNFANELAEYAKQYKQSTEDNAFAAIVWNGQQWAWSEVRVMPMPQPDAEVVKAKESAKPHKIEKSKAVEV
jgi:hypothetical protein